MLMLDTCEWLYLAQWRHNIAGLRRLENFSDSVETFSDSLATLLIVVVSLVFSISCGITRIRVSFLACVLPSTLHSAFVTYCLLLCASSCNRCSSALSWYFTLQSCSSVYPCYLLASTPPLLPLNGQNSQFGQVTQSPIVL